MESMKISLAGDLGSGKSTVGRIIGEKCGLEFYSTGTIQRKIALERGMTTYELNRYMEDHPEIDDEIDNGLKALENSDKNLVIDSRLAWHFVPISFAVYMTTMSEISARRIMNAKRDSCLLYTSSVSDGKNRGAAAILNISGSYAKSFIVRSTSDRRTPCLLYTSSWSAGKSVI